MGWYITKIAVTALLVVAVSEVAKRSSLAGGLLASVPLVSVLAMIWLYLETRDVARVSALAGSIFWLVLPSLLLFVTLPPLLRRGVGFPLALLLSIAITAAGYYGVVVLLQRFGARL